MQKIKELERENKEKSRQLWVKEKEIANDKMKEEILKNLCTSLWNRTHEMRSDT